MSNAKYEQSGPVSNFQCSQFFQNVKNEGRNILLLQVGDSVINQVTNAKGLELTAGPWVYDSHVKKSQLRKKVTDSRHHKKHEIYD